MNVCIIPARAGSKRIAHKNIKPFNDKPIIAYSIEAAQQSGCFERIIVSTDGKDIAQIAQKYGAEVPFIRPTHLANDFATTGAVMAHAVNTLITQNWSGKYVCCLYATAPFVQVTDIQTGLQQLQQQQADFAFSITRFDFPIQRALRRSKDGSITMFSPEYFATRSQDLTPAWHDAGQFYWGTTAAWLEQKPIFNSHSIGIELPSYRVQDIDTPDDWIRAQMLWHLINNTDSPKNQSELPSN